MQRFRVDLKTVLGLAMLPCGHKVNIRLVCRWNFRARNPKPYYSPTVLCDNTKNLSVCPTVRPSICHADNLPGTANIDISIT